MAKVDERVFSFEKFLNDALNSLVGVENKLDDVEDSINTALDMIESYIEEREAEED